MSSFPINLAWLTLGAKEHLARLEAASGGLRARLMSPLPGDAALPPHSAPAGASTVAGGLLPPSGVFASSSTFVRELSHGGAWFLW